MVTKSPPARFDPFADRLSRDIRNRLSTAFMATLARQDMSTVREAALAFLQASPAAVYREYIENRLQRYEKAISLIREQSAPDPFSRALVLWNHELFFEVHEILEHEWLQAEGAMKKVLQAMIRAAGVYVQLEHGNISGARKMADKAVEAFVACRSTVPPLFDLDLLLNRLRNLDPVPPKFS